MNMDLSHMLIPAANGAHSAGSVGLPVLMTGRLLALSKCGAALELEAISSELLLSVL